jgi:N-acetylmuramoyl-L-alanine amidase
MLPSEGNATGTIIPLRPDTGGRVTTEDGLIRPWASMLIALIAACSLVAAAHAPDAGAQQQQPPPLSGKTVVLDPGYGGNDWEPDT